DADAEKRSRLGDDPLAERRFETRDGGETAPAVGEGPDAGKNDAIGSRNIFRCAGHSDLGGNPGFGGSALKGFRGRAQIARAVIDDGDDHGRLPPRTPLVEGTAPARRGSISTAWRNARASPLKQDSTM